MPTMQAVWNGTVLAASDRYELVEGNVYFPAETVNRDLVRESATTSLCGWKGTASYYDVVVAGEANADAAWYYPDPLPEAANIKGYVAFWRGVEVGEAR